MGACVVLAMIDWTECADRCARPHSEESHWHINMDLGLPITQIHDVTDALEDRVKEKFPDIARVTIHQEPIEER